MKTQLPKNTFILTIHYTNGSRYTHRDVTRYAFTGKDVNHDFLAIMHKAVVKVVGGVTTKNSTETVIPLVDVAGVAITTYNELGKQVTYQSIKNRLKVFEPYVVEK